MSMHTSEITIVFLSTEPFSSIELGHFVIQGFICMLLIKKNYLPFILRSLLSYINCYTQQSFKNP